MNSRVVCAMIHVGVVAFCKAKIGTSTPTPCYEGPFKSKRMKNVVHRTLWFCSWEQKRCVGGKIEYSILLSVHVPNVWPMKGNTNQSATKLSILEYEGFEIARLLWT